MRHYCTLLDAHDLAKGLALVASLAQHETTPWVLHIVCLDEITRTLLLALGNPNIVTVALHAVEQRDDALIRSRETQSLGDYHRTLTPSAMLHVLAGQPEGSILTYVEPHVFFHSRPTPSLDQLGEASVVIHEHRYSKASEQPGENASSRVRLIGVRHDARGLAAITSWRKRRNEWRGDHDSHGAQSEEGDPNEWPQGFPGVVTSQHPAAEFAPCSHAARPLDLARYAEAVRGATSTIRNLHPEFEISMSTINIINETKPSQAPCNRARVVECLKRHPSYASLLAALDGANRVLVDEFAQEDVAKSRAILLGIVAQHLEQGPSAKEAMPPRPAAMAEGPNPATIQRLSAAVQRAADNNDLDAADAALAELTALIPDHADVHLTAGHLAIRRGNFHSAQERFIRASIVASNDDATLTYDVGEAFVQLALAWEANCDMGMARINAERALRIAPSHAEARQLCARFSAPPTTVALPQKGTPHATTASRMAKRDALFEQGERLAATGEWVAAKELFEALAAEYLDFAPAQVGVASACFAGGDVEGGLAALGRACTIEPKDIGLQVQRGKLLLQTGRLVHATELFRELVTRAPQNVDAHLGLAEAHRLQSNPIAAIDVLDAAHCAYPTEPTFIAAIGTLAAELGDKLSAEGALSALQALAPDHPRTLALHTELSRSATLGA